MLVLIAFVFINFDSILAPNRLKGFSEAEILDWDELSAHLQFTEEDALFDPFDLPPRPPHRHPHPDFNQQMKWEYMNVCRANGRKFIAYKYCHGFRRELHASKNFRKAIALICFDCYSYLFIDENLVLLNGDLGRFDSEDLQMFQTVCANIGRYYRISQKRVEWCVRVFKKNMDRQLNKLVKKIVPKQSSTEYQYAEMPTQPQPFTAGDPNVYSYANPSDYNPSLYELEGQYPQSKPNPTMPEEYFPEGTYESVGESQKSSKEFISPITGRLQSGHVMPLPSSQQAVYTVVNKPKGKKSKSPLTEQFVEEPSFQDPSSGIEQLAIAPTQLQPQGISTGVKALPSLVGFKGLRRTGLLSTDGSYGRTGNPQRRR